MNDHCNKDAKGKGVKTIRVKSSWEDYKGRIMVRATINYCCSACGKLGARYMTGVVEELEKQHFYCLTCKTIPLRPKYGIKAEKSR
jgi:triacylglycerol esterase/lipase EstA (alpha/beta hydrolase family)